MAEKYIIDENERDYREVILELIRSDIDAEELKVQLENYHDYDIATVVERLTPEEREILLAAIGYEAAARILPYLDNASTYLEEIEPEEAADIIENMDADEALEVLEDLDEKMREEVLDLIDDEEVKEEIEFLDSYPDGVYGSRMSTSFITIERGSTIKAAMKTLVSMAAENDNIHKLFINDADGRYYGAIDLKELIIARSTDELESLIYTAFPFVYDTDIIDESIERVRGYSEDLIPVIGKDSGKVVGVITSADVAELVNEGIGDDYAKLAALGSEEESGESLGKSIKKRIPWLIILLFLGLAVSAVVGLFEGVVEKLPMIVAFQSLILGMAGNVGTQSLAVTVRSLGQDVKLTFLERVKLVFKETRIAFLNGLILGCVSFVIVMAYLLIRATEMTFALMAAGCVGLAMCFAMLISGFTGAVIPMTLDQMGADPAVASGPLITTINDLVAVVSYYTLAYLLLIGLV